MGFSSSILLLFIVTNVAVFGVAFFSSTMFCGVVLVLWGIAYTIGLQVVVLNTSVYLQGKRIEDYFHHFWNIMSSYTA